jgi:hypothetical protein
MNEEGGISLQQEQTEMKSRLDKSDEICYILVTNCAITDSDDKDTTDHKIAHLEEVYEVAEEWLWNARAHKHKLVHPSRFKPGDLVRVPKESAVGRYDIGRINKVEATPDNYRYTISIHKTFWRQAFAEIGDEGRFKTIYKFEEDLLPAPAGTTNEDLIPKKYRIKLETTGERKLQEPNKPNLSLKEMEEFMAKLREVL